MTEIKQYQIVFVICLVFSVGLYFVILPTDVITAHNFLGLGFFYGLAFIITTILRIILKHRQNPQMRTIKTPVITGGSITVKEVMEAVEELEKKK